MGLPEDPGRPFLADQHLSIYGICPASDPVPVHRRISHYEELVLLTLAIFLLRHKSPFVKNPLNKLLFLYFLVILLSSMFAMSPVVAFEKVPEFISWMIVFFLIVNIVNTEKRFFIFMLVFLLYSLQDGSILLP